MNFDVIQNWQFCAARNRRHVVAVQLITGPEKP
jgi:hypothetical protein